MDPARATVVQRTPAKAPPQSPAPPAAAAARATPPPRDHCDAESRAAIKRFLVTEQHQASAEEAATSPSWSRHWASQTHPVGRLSASSRASSLSLSPGRPAVREQLLLLQQFQQHPEGHYQAPPRFFRAKTLEVAEQHPEAEAEPQDEVSMLREQVALLLKSLEDEKKRRMHEHKLMQEKIIELQGLIRRNLPEQQKAQERRFVQMRSPSAARTKPRSSSKHSIRSQLGRKSSKSGDELTAFVRRSSKSSDELKVLVRKASKSSDELSSLSHHSSKSSDVGASSDCDDDNSHNQTSHEEDAKLSVPAAALSFAATSVAPVDSPNTVARPKSENEDPETRLKKQLTKLRARMQAMVTEAQAETETLRSLLKSERQNHERRERQLRVEANAKHYALEERHASAKERMSAKMTRLSSQISHLQSANQMLAEELNEKDARIAHLELAVGGMHIVQSSLHESVGVLSPQQQQQN